MLMSETRIQVKIEDMVLDMVEVEGGRHVWVLIVFFLLIALWLIYPISSEQKKVNVFTKKFISIYACQMHM
jgi:hypothetical protein